MVKIRRLDASVTKIKEIQGQGQGETLQNFLEKYGLSESRCELLNSLREGKIGLDSIPVGGEDKSLEPDCSGLGNLIDIEGDI